MANEYITTVVIDKQNIPTESKKPVMSPADSNQIGSSTPQETSSDDEFTQTYSYLT